MIEGHRKSIHAGLLFFHSSPKKNFSIDGISNSPPIFGAMTISPILDLRNGNPSSVSLRVKPLTYQITERKELSTYMVLLWHVNVEKKTCRCSTNKFVFEDSLGQAGGSTTKVTTSSWFYLFFILNTNWSNVIRRSPEFINILKSQETLWIIMTISFRHFERTIHSKPIDDISRFKLA